MIKFFNITDRESVEYLDAIEVYKAGTADELQIKTKEIEKKMDSGNAVIILGKQNILPVFMALLWKLEGTNFYVNEIISIIPSAKNMPLGKIYMEVLKASEYLKNSHILFEVEDPDFGDRNERQKKLDFYFTHGLSLVDGVKTIVPSPISEDYTNTLLCILSHSRFLKITQDEMKALITKLYADLYQQKPEEYLLKSILENIPETIRLLGFMKA